MKVDYRIMRLRCLAIIVVVLGHSIILYDPNGGGYSSSYSVPTLICLKQIINLFQMPLFFFLSGFCVFLLSKKTSVHKQEVYYKRNN